MLSYWLKMVWLKMPGICSERQDPSIDMDNSTFLAFLDSAIQLHTFICLSKKYLRVSGILDPQTLRFGIADDHRVAGRFSKTSSKKGVIECVYTSIRTYPQRLPTLYFRGTAVIPWYFHGTLETAFGVWVSRNFRIPRVCNHPQQGCDSLWKPIVG